VFKERDVIYLADNDKPGAIKLPGRDRRSQALPGAFALRAAGLRPSDVASVDISLGQDREVYRVDHSLVFRAVVAAFIPARAD
jgi:hypothetical protein